MLYDSVNHVINAFSPQGCWGMVQEKGSRERCRSWTVLHAQRTSALSSGFPISQGNAETLKRWGGKTKHRLISYFLSNTSAKIIIVGLRISRLQQVKGGTFFETRCRSSVPVYCCIMRIKSKKKDSSFWQHGMPNKGINCLHILVVLNRILHERHRRPYGTFIKCQRHCFCKNCNLFSLVVL